MVSPQVEHKSLLHFTNCKICTSLQLLRPHLLYWYHSSNICSWIHFSLGSFFAWPTYCLPCVAKHAIKIFYTVFTRHVFHDDVWSPYWIGDNTKSRQILAASAISCIVYNLVRNVSQVCVWIKSKYALDRKINIWMIETAIIQTMIQFLIYIEPT